MISFNSVAWKLALPDKLWTAKYSSKYFVQQFCAGNGHCELFIDTVYQEYILIFLLNLNKC